MREGGDANRSRRELNNWWKKKEKLCSEKKQLNGLSEGGRWQQSLGEDVFKLCACHIYCHLPKMTFHFNSWRRWLHKQLTVTPCFLYETLQHCYASKRLSSAVRHVTLSVVKVKVKCSRYRPGVALRVGRGIAVLFHDRGTRRGEWSAARPGRILPPGKTRYPFYRRLGGPQGRSGRAENLVPTGIRSRTVQPVVSRYTDGATWPT